jgi:hypothetical protein
MRREAANTNVECGCKNSSRCKHIGVEQLDGQGCMHYVPSLNTGEKAFDRVCPGDAAKASKVEMVQD